MYFLAGMASATAMDLISSLRQGLFQSTGTKSAQGSQASPFNVASNATNGASGPSSGASSTSSVSSPLSSATMNALLAAQSDRSDGRSSQLFSLLDADRDGKVSKAEVEKVLAAGGEAGKAGAVFAKLDADRDGSVSQSELSSALAGARHRHGVGGMPDLGNASSGGSNTGSTTKTVTHPDGSVTTKITYADGSSVSMTRPAANAAAAGNPLEQLIQRQAQLLSASTAGQSLAVSA